MNPRRLKRLFPNASKAFQRLNSDNLDDTRVSSEPEPLDRQEVCQALGGKKMGEKYKLQHVDIVFHANHGKKFDQDNCRYVAKPILDALVNLGFVDDDKDLTSEATQRMDENNPEL